MTELKKKSVKRLTKTENDQQPERKKPKATEFKGKPKFDGKQKKFDGQPKKFDGQKKFEKKPDNNAEPIKQNWQELKKHKKELKIKRKMNKSKDMYDLDVKCKKIYEELKM